MLGGINFIPQAASALPDVQRAAEGRRRGWTLVSDEGFAITLVPSVVHS